MIWWVKLSQPNLSIVFPAYNEEKNIVACLEAALPFVKTHNAEIIVIDDGSQDKTAVLVQSYTHVKLIQHNENRGYGAALRTGFAHSKGKWIFFTDSDLQFRLDELHEFWRYTTEYDVIIGYRYPRKDPRYRILYAKVWAVLVNHAMKISIRDVNCAFKLIKNDALSALSLEAKGAAINAEILKKLSSKRIIQLPVSHYPRAQGIQTGAKFTVILRALWELLLLQKDDSEVQKP